MDPSVATEAILQRMIKSKNNAEFLENIDGGLVSLKNKTPEVQAEEPKVTPARTIKWVPIISWGVTALLVASLVFVLIKFNPFTSKEDNQPETNAPLTVEVTLPAMQSSLVNYSVPRLADFDTLIPNGNRQYPIKYTIQEGDSIFSIAKQFNLEPAIDPLGELRFA